MRIPVTISASALLSLVEECRVEVWLRSAKSTWSPYVKFVVSMFCVSRRIRSITSRNHVKPTHTAHHPHVSTHTHHAAAHTHHISAHGHVHPTHVVHAHVPASSTAVLHSTSSHTAVHHATAVEAASSEVVHRAHGVTTKVVDGRWRTIPSHGTSHISTDRARKIAVLEANIVVSTTVVEVAPVIVEAVVISTLLATLVAAIVTRRRTVTAVVLLAGWDIFGKCLERVDVGWIEDGGGLLRMRLVFVESV